MLDFKLLHEPSAAIDIPVTFTSIIGVGYVFACFDSIIATLVILPTFPILLLFVNVVLLRHHIWFDFSIPLLGIFLHRTIARLEEYLTARQAGQLARHDVHGHRNGES